MLDELIERFHWYYALVAAALFGLIYILEVQLDLPIWDHECPGISHINLKRLIQRIVEHVLSVPDLLNQSGVPDRDEEPLPYFDPKKYEELLATAVLNKVVDNFRNKENATYPSNVKSDLNLDDNHNALKAGKEQLDQPSTSSSVEPQSLSSESESLLEQPMSFNEELSTPSSPSNFGQSPDNESYLSDYIKKHKVPLPDISGESELNDDDKDSLTSSGTDGTWDENWLFKKKVLKNDATSIAMLVPSPTEEVKALIGDKNADEVSDLSEAGSDDDEDEQPASLDIPNILVQNKTIIGGKNEFAQYKEPNKETKSEIPASLNIFEPLVSVNKLIDAEIENGFVNIEKPTIEEMEKDFGAASINLIEAEAVNPFVEIIEPPTAFTDTKTASPIPAPRVLPSTEELPTPPAKIQSDSSTNIEDNTLITFDSLVGNSSDLDENVDHSFEIVCGLPPEGKDAYRLKNEFEQVASELNLNELEATENKSEPILEEKIVVLQATSISLHEINHAINSDKMEDKLEEIEEPVFKTMAVSFVVEKELPELKLHTFDTKADEIVSESLVKEEQENNEDVKEELGDQIKEAVRKLMEEEEKAQAIPLNVEAELPELQFLIFDTKGDTDEASVKEEEKHSEIVNEELGGKIQEVVRKIMEVEEKEEAQATAFNVEEELSELKVHLVNEEVKAKADDVVQEVLVVESSEENRENINEIEDKITKDLPGDLVKEELLNLDEILGTSGIVKGTVTGVPASTLYYMPSDEFIFEIRDFIEKNIPEGEPHTPFDYIWEEEVFSHEVENELPALKSEVKNISEEGVFSAKTIPGNVEKELDPAVLLQTLISNARMQREAKETNEVVTVPSIAKEESKEENLNSVDVEFKNFSEEELFSAKPIPSNVEKELGPALLLQSLISNAKMLREEKETNEAVTVPLIAKEESVAEKLNAIESAEAEAVRTQEIVFDVQKELPELKAELEKISEEILFNVEKEIHEKQHEAKEAAVVEEEVTELVIPPCENPIEPIVHVDEFKPEFRINSLETEVLEAQFEEETYNSLEAEIFVEEKPKVEIATSPVPRYSSPLFKSMLPQSPVQAIKISDTLNKITNKQVEDTKNTNPFIVTEDKNSINESLTEETPAEIKETEENHLIPGSIAEREHLKWQNAAPIENNPYSSEALQKRLEDKNTDHTFDLGVVEEADTNPETPNFDRLEDVFKADLPNHKRFGRDYYINEAKKASGERLKWSQMNQQSQDENSITSTRSPSPQQVLSPEPPIVPVQRSSSFGDSNFSNENIFAARPIQVEEDDPILKRAKKLDVFSTDDREFYLLPAEEAQKLNLSDSEIASLQQTDSLSFSEDSDSTRIYDLCTRETQILNTNKKSTPPQSPLSVHKSITPVIIDKNTREFESLGSNSVEIISLQPKVVNSQLKKPFISTIDIKPLSPDTVKFFAPKKKGFFAPPKTKMGDEIALEQQEVVRSNGNIEKEIIEAEVAGVLPSVKELMKSFGKNNAEPSGPVVRPTSIQWQSSKDDTDGRERQHSPESFVTPFNQTYHPALAPGHSITGRSLSNQFKEQLKDVNNEIPRSVSPERPPSPVLVPGKLRNSIAFFENLKK